MFSHVFLLLLSLTAVTGQLYVTLRASTNSCQRETGGSHRRMNAAECETMAKSGFVPGGWGYAGSSSSYPRGCYRYSDGKAYFNSHSSGASRSSSRPICMSTSGTVTPTPAPPNDGGSDSYRVVVLGDVHGDYDTMIAMLRNNGILDSSHRWRNTRDKVISVGDLIGRGYQDRQVLEFVMAQQRARPRQWIQLLGNHEVMQVRGDWRYAVDGSNRGFGSLSNRQRALRRGSTLGDWLRSLPVIHQEADNIFMHAGMSDTRNVGRSLGSLNREITSFLGGSSTRQVYNDLLWNRDLVRQAYAGASGICSRRVPDILRTFGAQRMFVGHTTVYSSSLAGRNQRDPLRLCSGTFYNVDVGISRWMRNTPRNLVLSISSGRTGSITTVRTATVGRRLVSDEDLFAPEEFMRNVDPDPYGESTSTGGLPVQDAAFMWKEAVQLESEIERPVFMDDIGYAISADEDWY